MFRLIGKLIKFVVIIAIILGLLVGLLYVGSEVLELEFCEEIVDELEDVIDEMFDGSSSSMEKEGVAFDVFPGESHYGSMEVTSDLPGSIREAYVVGDKVGYVFLIEAHNEERGSTIDMMVGVDREGFIRGAKLLDHSEVDAGVDLFEYVRRFTGMNLDELSDRYEDMIVYENPAVSKTVISAIADALVAESILDGRIDENSDDGNSSSEEGSGIEMNMALATAGNIM